MLQKLPSRTKKLVSVRHLTDDDGESSDTVVYMQSVAESSLTEDLSKYDFTQSQVCKYDFIQSKIYTMYDLTQFQVCKYDLTQSKIYTSMT